MNKKEVVNQIENLFPSDIVEKAMEGWLKSGKKKDGIAVYDPETRKLESISLGTGEEIRGDERIYLYTIPHNILGNNGYELEDWLSPEEIDDMKKREEEGEYLSPEDYIEKYTDDSVEERLEEILLYYFDEEGLDWNSIEFQLDNIFPKKRVKFTTNIDEKLLKEVKMVALLKDVGVNDIIEELLEEYLSDL
jgi:hypothetical protein